MSDLADVLGVYIARRDEHVVPTAACATTRFHAAFSDAAGGYVGHPNRTDPPQSAARPVSERPRPAVGTVRDDPAIGMTMKVRVPVEQEPSVELGSFSTIDAVPTEWASAREVLRDAEVYWLSTLRPSGRPHVTALVGVWLDGAVYFCTGPAERKAKNLVQNAQCVVTTGCNRLDGLDVVVEGAAELVGDEAELRSVAGAYESNYGAPFTEPEGIWSGPCWCHRRWSSSGLSGCDQEIGRLGQGQVVQPDPVAIR